MPPKDKEAQRIRHHEYYLLHKEQIAQRCKAWVAANPDKRRASSRDWARRNYVPGDAAAKQAATQKASAWARANPDRVNAKNRAWRAAHRERYKAIQQNWRLIHRAKAQELKQARRARELNAFVERVERQAVYDRANGICGICGLPVSFDKFHLDHVIPLSKGGLHSYANTQPAHPSCNSKKGNQLDYSANVRSK